MKTHLATITLVVIGLCGGRLNTTAGILAGPINNPANGHVYYLLTEASWTTSEQEAVNLGGHLATINDQQEQDWVWTQFGAYQGSKRSLWIGLNDAATEGTFVWVSGDPPKPVSCIPEADPGNDNLESTEAGDI